MKPIFTIGLMLVCRQRRAQYWQGVPHSAALQLLFPGAGDATATVQSCLALALGYRRRRSCRPHCSRYHRPIPTLRQPPILY